jgi:large subunit ribosomal protein L29
VSAASELRGLTDSELEQKLQEAYQELLNLRFRKATKQLDNTARIRVVRRDISRIKTLMREREVEAEGEVPGA